MAIALEGSNPSSFTLTYFYFMFIKINNEYILEITDKNLIVQDKKLYNKDTKLYEGVSGDIVSFDLDRDGKTWSFRAPIDTYTCGTRIPIYGTKEPYHADKKTITHISVVSEYIDDNKELQIASM